MILEKSSCILKKLNIFRKYSVFKIKVMQSKQVSAQFDKVSIDVFTYFYEKLER